MKKYGDFSDEVKFQVGAAYNGYCALCDDRAHSPHHKFENTKWHNGKYPLFTQSIFNAIPLCQDCHTNKKHLFKIPEELVAVYEEHLNKLGGGE